MVYQLGSALLDAFVLAIVSKGDAYGYQISQEIKTVVNLKESTLYPVLKRMQEAGYLEVYDRPFQGRNRRYYRITDSGQDKKRYYVKEWIDFGMDVERILRGGESDEQTGISADFE